MQRAVVESGGAVPSPATGGWLSPEGRYWPCPDCEHQQAADAIVRNVGLPTDRDAEKVLEEAGWVHVSDNGMVHSFLGATVLFPDFTQAQLDVMFDLACAHPSMRKELLEELDGARERSEREAVPHRCRTTRVGQTSSYGSRWPTSRGESRSSSR
jgi:hypothetical protein